MEPRTVPVEEVLFVKQMIDLPCLPNFLISIVFDYSSTEHNISPELIMYSFKVCRFANLFQIIGQKIFSASWEFTKTVAEKSSFLDAIFRIKEKPM